MKKWIFLILLLNINISYGDVPLGYKTLADIPFGFKSLTDYCDYFDPGSYAWVETNLPERAYCVDNQEHEIATLACCLKGMQYFWLKISSLTDNCSIGRNSPSIKCNKNTAVY